MQSLKLSDKVFDKLKIIEGKEFDEKILNLLETNALMRLKECEEQIFSFESRHRMDFENFKNAWTEGSIKDKHSHKIERDFMEWEGFEIERKKWLNILKDIRIVA